MQSDGGGVDVALRHDAGRIDKFLELGAVAQRGGVEVGCRADGLQVDVYDRVRFRQKARGFGRGFLAQEQRDRHRDQYCQRDKQRSVATSSHDLFGNRKRKNLAGIGKSPLIA